MDIRENYNSLIIYVNDENELIELENFINSVKEVGNTIIGSITLFPNYVIYRININRINYLTNNLRDYISLKHMLEEVVSFDSAYRPYEEVYNVNDKDFRKIKNIILHGKEVYRPDYSPKKIIRENKEYKYNGWVIFKINNQEETDFVISNLDIDGDYEKSFRFPYYILYNFTTKSVINLYYDSDYQIIRFIKSLDANISGDNYNKLYCIEHVFYYKDVLKLEFIRNYGKLLTPNYSPKNIIKTFESFTNNKNL